MKRIIYSTISVLLVFSFISCRTVSLDTFGLGQTVSMTGEINKDYTFVKHFEEDLKGVFMIFDLITIKDPNVKKLVESEIKAANGDAAINIRIKGQMSFIDGLIPVAVGVLGVLAMPPYGSILSTLIGFRTYTIEGDIVKYKEK